MDKKTLGIILAIVVVGIAYFGYQRGLFSGGGISGIIGGVREDSMMGAMRKQGQPVVSKSEFIAECKKSNKESQDECYGIGAFYYRDASLCKYIKDSETKSQCTQENIEKMYKGQEEMTKEYQKELDKLTPEERKAAEEMMKAYSGGGMIPGTGIIPGAGGLLPSLPIPNGGEILDGRNVPEGGVVPDGEPEVKGEPADIYGSAKEIAAPTGLASELKSILSGACGGAKLTILNYDFPVPGADMMVYVWKNKSTEEKLISAFEKNGYEIEMPGEILMVRKGNLFLTVDWASADREEGQEIVVLVQKEE